MNTFELKIVIVPPDGSQQRGPLVTQQIWIDGQHLDEPFPVDLRELVSSLFSPGSFYIFTCGCGIPECAGIWEGVDVRHELRRIAWRFRRPVSDESKQIYDPDERFEFWRAHAKFVEYVFDRDAMKSALEQGLKSALDAPSDAEFSPYGMDRKTLATLSTKLHPPSWDEPHGRRHLYFLADEECPWFLEGQFISPDSLGLGLSQTSLNAFEAWQLRGHHHRLDPAFRLSWLEEVRQLLLSAYVNGLSADIDLKLIARLRSKSEGLDLWALDTRDLDRSLLDIESPLELAYLCLSASRSGFVVWLDDTPEVKDYRAHFLGNGAKVFEAIVVPFKLERELYEWACSIPDSNRWADGGDRVALWDFDGQRPLSCAEIRDWESFHCRGIQLAEQLQAIVGPRATVLYEMPSNAPVAGDVRRFLVRGRSVDLIR